MPVFKRGRSDVRNNVEGSSSEDENMPRKNQKQKASRAEKSRCAAKMRRDKEGVELARLSALLPFPEEVISKLDKGSILRLAISYLQMKEYTKSARDAFLEEIQANENEGPEKMEVDEGDLMLHALNGFLIFVNKKGKVLYISDHVHELLGLETYELIGRGIFEYIHPDDQREFAKQFLDKPPRTGHLPALPSPMDVSGNDMDLDDSDEIDPTTFVKERLFYIRMKCHVTKKGSKVKQTGFVLTQWSGRLKLKSHGLKNQGIMGLMGLVRPMQSAPLLEIRLDGNMFMSRHQLDMTFTFCDPRISSLIGYDPTEVIGRTAYQFHNPMDACKIQNCHSNLIVKGTSVSKYYRFLGKLGEWVWMQTRATIVYNTSNQPQYVVCMNYVISQEEGKRYLMMEQEEQGEKDLNCGGFIDVTNVTDATTTKHASNTPRLSEICGGVNDIHSPTSPGSSQLSSGYESSSPCPQNHSPVPGSETRFHNKNSQPTVSCSSNPLTNVNPSEVDFLASVASSLADAFPSSNSGTIAAGNHQTSNVSCMTGFNGHQNSLGNQMPPCSTGFPTDMLSDNLDSFDLDVGTLQWLEDPGHVTQADLDELTTQAQSVDSILPFASTDVLVSSTSNPKLSSTSESFTNMSHKEDKNYPLVNNMDTDNDVEMIDAFSSVPSKHNRPFKQTFSASDIGVSKSDMIPIDDDQSNNSILASLLGVTEAQLQQKVHENKAASRRSNGKTTTKGVEPIEKGDNSFKGNISLHMLPPGILGVTDNANDSQHFASKFAEHAANQAMNQVLQHHQGNTNAMSPRNRNGVVSNLHQSAAAVVSTEHSYFRTEAVTARASSPDTRQGVCQQQKSSTQTLNSVRQPRLSSFVSPSPQSVSESQISSPTITSTSAVQSLLVSNQPIKDYKRPDLNQTSYTRGHYHQPHSTTNTNGHRHQQYNHYGNSATTNGHANGHNNGVRQKNVTNKTLLEKMLLTQEPLNPNEGSDRAFSENQFSEKISQLNLGGLNEAESPLLKKLLTGEIDKQGVRRFEERVIETRKQTTHKDHYSDVTESTIDLELNSPDPIDDNGINMKLFGMESDGDMEKLWELDTESNNLMQSDLEDILEEQNRQEDLWLRQYFSIT